MVIDLNSQSNKTDRSWLDKGSCFSALLDLSIGQSVVSGVFLAGIIIMTVGGNIIVLMAVGLSRQLRSTTTILIANLAVADLLLGFTVLPFSAVWTITELWLFGQIFCNVWTAIDVLCCTASILSLCAISLDRYIGVTYPLQHSSIMTHRRLLFMVLIIWILSGAISMAPFVGWRESSQLNQTSNSSLLVEVVSDQSQCLCNVNSERGYVIFSASFSFYIPLLVILLVYFRIYVEATKQSKFLSKGIKTAKCRVDGSDTQLITLRVHTGGSTAAGTNGSSKLNNPDSSPKGSGIDLAGKWARFRREQKAAKTLGIVVGVFILCWFPFFIILPIEALCSHCKIPKVLFRIVFWLGYCNSMCNPVIYACSNREFKWAFHRILRCRWHRTSGLTQQGTNTYNNPEPVTTGSIKTSRSLQMTLMNHVTGSDGKAVSGKHRKELYRVTKSCGDEENEINNCNIEYSFNRKSPRGEHITDQHRFPKNIDQSVMDSSRLDHSYFPKCPRCPGGFCDPVGRQDSPLPMLKVAFRCHSEEKNCDMVTSMSSSSSN